MHEAEEHEADGRQEVPSASQEDLLRLCVSAFHQHTRCARVALPKHKQRQHKHRRYHDLVGGDG